MIHCKNYSLIINFDQYSLIVQSPIIGDCTIREFDVLSLNLILVKSAIIQITKFSVHASLSVYS